MGLYDLVSLSTTVTAQSGATVTLASVAGLTVGDKIIIESDHGYDEVGLDGDWSISNFPLAGGGYYTDVTHVGKSFISGPITDISGNVVTVDRTVPAGAVGLPCHRNNRDSIKYAIENKLAWPRSKRLATSHSVIAYLTDDYHEIDFNNCTLFAPKGCIALNLSIARIGGGAVSNKRYANLTMQGNAGDAGYGLFVENGIFTQGASMQAALNIAGTGGATPTRARNIVVENVHFIDNWRACTFQVASDCIGKNLTSTNTQPLRQYVQWDFQQASTERCAFIDCTVDGDYMRAGFEAFKATSGSFIRCGGRNVSFSVNTSGSVSFRDCSVVLDNINPPESFSPNNPIFNLNRAIETQQGSVQPGTDGGVGISNFSVEYREIPYPNNGASGEIWSCLVVNNHPYDVPVRADIRGLTLTLPRTNVTRAGGGTVGYVLDVNGHIENQDVYGVTATQIDGGSKFTNNVTEVVPA